MEQHPIKDGAFRMSGAVNSCHSKDKDSGNRPEEASEILSSGSNRN